MPVVNRDIAIIGAGFTGVALAVRLFRTLSDRASVLLIGTPHETGKGYAYGTELPDHLLNVRAGRMSIISDEPDHFVHWLKLHGHNDDNLAEGYLPRAVYGAYVRDTLYKCVSAQRERLRAEVREATVIDVERYRDGFAIQFASGERARAKAVILATGNGRGDFPFATGEAGDVGDVMIRDPFLDYRMKTVDANARILLIGTGLTMVDQLLRLESGGHRGPIVAISRHGLLPAPHPARQRAVRPPALPVGVSLTGLLRSQIAEARLAIRDGDDWQSLLDGLRPQVQRLWQGLSSTDRRRFLRHAEAFWSVHRHRMAPSVAERLSAARREGRLVVRAGRVIGVRKNRGVAMVAFRPRAAAAIELLSFDWIVNCSGIGARSLKNDPLIAILVARGMVRAASFVGGIDVTPESQAIDGGGNPVPGLFAAGPLTVGTFFEITAVPEIREQVAAVARTVSDYLIGGAFASRQSRASEAAPTGDERSGRR